MKKIFFIAVTLFLVLTLSQHSYAKTYYRTYKVAEITVDGIVLEDLDGKQLLVNKDASGYMVGDLVRYDKVRNVLRKSPWQFATVSKITDRAITLKLTNGKKAEISMRASYRNEFAEGEQVSFKASTGQIKKSNLPPVNEE